MSEAGHHRGGPPARPLAAGIRWRITVLAAAGGILIVLLALHRGQREQSEGRQQDRPADLAERPAGRSGRSLTAPPVEPESVRNGEQAAHPRSEEAAPTSTDDGGRLEDGAQARVVAVLSMLESCDPATEPETTGLTLPELIATQESVLNTDDLNSCQTEFLMSSLTTETMSRWSTTMFERFWSVRECELTAVIAVARQMESVNRGMFLGRALSTLSCRPDPAALHEVLSDLLAAGGSIENLDAMIAALVALAVPQSPYEQLSWLPLGVRVDTGYAPALQARLHELDEGTFPALQFVTTALASLADDGFEPARMVLGDWVQLVLDEAVSEKEITEWHRVRFNLALNRVGDTLDHEQWMPALYRFMTEEHERDLRLMTLEAYAFMARTAEGEERAARIQQMRELILDPVLGPRTAGLLPVMDPDWAQALNEALRNSSLGLITRIEIERLLAAPDQPGFLRPR